MGYKLYLSKAYKKERWETERFRKLKLKAILAFKFICKYKIERSHLIFN